MTPSITQDAINTALGIFLASILPAGVKVIVGQVNRVASPEGDFVVMWPLQRPRLATNLETNSDTKFEGSIAATVMTVTAIDFGEIIPGNPVFGTDVADGTTVVRQIGGDPGGVGTYTIDPTQTVGAGVLSAGTVEVEQDTDCVMQLDIHGSASTDNAQTISTLMRSAYAATQMEPAGVTPLYAEDPRQMPFLTAANQYEDRWMVDVHLQINPVVSQPQQFADSFSLESVEVDTFESSVFVVEPTPQDGLLVIIAPDIFEGDTYTVGPDDETIVVKKVPFTVELPNPPTFSRVVHIKNGTNQPGVEVSGAMDGGTGQSLGPYAAIDVQWSGTEWSVL